MPSPMARLGFLERQALAFWLSQLVSQFRVAHNNGNYLHNVHAFSLFLVLVLQSVLPAFLYSSQLVIHRDTNNSVLLQIDAILPSLYAGSPAFVHFRLASFFFYM